MVMIAQGVPGEIKVLLNHIYEYKKGVRHLILHTLNKCYLPIAIERLKSQGICYTVQEASEHAVNLYFGRPECVETIRLITTRPLNQLSPEEDFMLGAMLGYDIAGQCERYCKRKSPGVSSEQAAVNCPPPIPS